MALELAGPGYSKTMAGKTESARFDVVRQWAHARAERGWWHSFELPDGTFIEGVCPLAGLKNRLAQFPIPEDLRGKRVLDIGAWDGWYSFEMERRGAEVLAIDNWDNPLFHQARAMLNSRVEYRQIDMYELTPERVGRFDIVLFLGVLYHLKHPLLALERVCALTTEMAAVDSFILREEHRPGERVDQRPVMEFYETNEFGGQTDNWVAPSLACLQAFCRTAGFARVELRNVLEHSACLACDRHWERPSAGAPEGPELLAALHNLSGGINFDSSRDELVSGWFRWNAPRLGLNDVRPEVGGYGIRPIDVAQMGENEWQANFKLPPGLTPGWHEVRIRIGGSRPGSAQRIAVDVPLVAGEIRIQGVSDGTTWAKNQIDLSRGDVLSFWASGLPENIDCGNLSVILDGRRLTVIYVGAAEEEARQINVKVPKECPAGRAVISVSAGNSGTASADIEISGVNA
jgi:tRNA (mo5U34)-methyltransferase